MPEQDFQKIRPHPAKATPPGKPAGARTDEGDGAGGTVPLGPRYAELAAVSNFSFLTGASHPEELVERAGELGYHAVGIADTNTLAGVVRAHAARVRRA